MITILLYIMCAALLFGMGVFAGGYIATQGVFRCMEEMEIEIEEIPAGNTKIGAVYCFNRIGDKIGYSKGE